MTAKTHDLVAFGSLLVLATYYPQDNLDLLVIFILIISNIVGALLPDIDQASNRLWDLLPGGNFIGKILRNIFLSHRTLSHSLIGIALFYYLFKWLLPKIFNPILVDPNLILASLMIGYLSHLVADGLTEEGLPVLFPLKYKFGIPPIKKWRIKSGGWFEKWILRPGVAFYIVWWIIKNYDVLIKPYLN